MKNRCAERVALTYLGSNTLKMNPSSWSKYTKSKQFYSKYYEQDKFTFRSFLLRHIHMCHLYCQLLALKATSNLRHLHLQGFPVRTHSNVPIIIILLLLLYLTHSDSVSSQVTFTFMLFLSRYINMVHLYYQLLAFIAHSSLATI